MSEREDTWDLWAKTRLSFLAALCVLIPVQIWSVCQSDWLTKPPKPIGDGMDYESIAYQLWQGNGFVIDTADSDWASVYEAHPDIYRSRLDRPNRHLVATGRPPLFPGMVASIYSLVGRNPFGFAAVRICSALCLALSGALAAALSTFLLLWRNEQRTNKRATRLVHLAAWSAAMLLAASQRTLASYALDFLTEPLALLLTQSFLCIVLADHYLAQHALDAADNSNSASNSRWLKVLAGILLGAMILCRSIFVFWIPAILFMLVLSYPGRLSKRFQSAICILLVAACCCLPWWIRNCSVLHAPQPLGTQGPITLLGGYSDAGKLAGGEWQPQPEMELRRELRSLPSYQNLDDSEFEIALAQVAKQRVFGWIHSNLESLPLMMLTRVATHWNPYSGRSLAWKLMILAGVLYVVRYPWACRVWLIGPLLVSSFAVALLYSVGGRFLVPLYGILFTLPSLAVGESLGWFTQLTWKPRNRNHTAS